VRYADWHLKEAGVPASHLSGEDVVQEALADLSRTWADVKVPRAWMFKVTARKIARAVAGLPQAGGLDEIRPHSTVTWTSQVRQGQSEVTCRPRLITVGSDCGDTARR
jgi:hypothetical protein